jgi:hypothetical protein
MPVAETRFGRAARIAPDSPGAALQPDSTYGARQQSTAELETPGASETLRSRKHQSSSHAGGGRAPGTG